jgi:hypothetical protein
MVAAAVDEIRGAGKLRSHVGRELRELFSLRDLGLGRICYHAPVKGPVRNPFSALVQTSK